MKALIPTLLLLSLITSESVPAAPLCESPKGDQNTPSGFENLQLGDDDWLFRKHDLITRFGPGRIGYNGIEQLQSALAAAGTTLVMVPIPTRAIVHPEKLGDVAFDQQVAVEAYAGYLNRLRDRGVVVPELETMASSEDNEALFFARDHHWTPEGAKRVAAMVARTLEQRGLLDDINALVFSNIETSTTNNPGSYQRAATSLCNRSFDPEPFGVFESQGGLDLFDEPSTPEIVLVGTSNSKGVMHFNFDGFLKEALSRDVLNLAKSGGGYDEAITTFLASDLFREHPPKILIWEVPGYYSLNTGAFYERLLGSMEKKS